MKIMRELASQRLAEYMEKVLLPGLKGGKKDNGARFRIGVALGLGLVKVADEQWEMLKDAGAVDADGSLDLDVVRKGAMAGVVAAGGEVYVDRLGVWLSSDDVAKLIAYMESGSLG